MTRHAVVVGAGVIGCSVALELRRRAYRVTVVDRNGEAGHGTTSASCGVVRRYYSQPGMIAMAQEASEIWAHWGDHLGPIDEDLAAFKRPGMLFILPRVDAAVHALLAEERRVGVKASFLTADEVRERFPYLDVSSHFPARPASDPRFLEPSDRPIAGAIFEEDSGYVVSPGVATTNLRRAGEREGVEFLMNRAVTVIRRAGPMRLVVATDRGDALGCDVVVNAAGPHSGALNRLAGARLPLETRPLRREVHVLKNPLFGLPSGAAVPVVGDVDGGVYFRPESGGRDIVIGSTDPECDAKEFVEDPDDYGDGITDLYHERQCLRAMQRFPAMTLGRPRGVASLYDVTVRDWYPIADKTDLFGYYVCIGTSGSSFKTAPVLGRLMAELIDRNQDGFDTDVDPLRLELPRIGVAVDTRFLSRRRGELETTGTVIG
jgi:glycine/D-amino acid oxidase-like deaminating enzyme